MGKSVLIIGGGIAGLSAGSYLARNGYQTTILEQHALPGGLCTSWKRKRYTVDYCIHWLMGTRAGNEFHQIWNELGAFDNPDGTRMEIRNFDCFSHIGLSNGSMFPMHASIDKLSEELLSLAPEDKGLIDKFCKDLYALSKLETPALSEKHRGIKKAAGFIRNVKGNLTMMKHATTTIGTYVKECRNALLKELFYAAIPQDWSLISLSLGLALQHTRKAGYPVGGSLALSRNIEQTYLKHGGEIRYQARAASVITEGGKASGAVLDSGDELRSDIVISAADGYQTLFSMLKGIEIPRALKNAYETYPLFPSSFLLALGIGRDLSQFPHAQMPRLKKPLILPDGDEHPTIHINTYHYDPTLSPKGKTLVTVLINSWKGPYWIDLRENDPSGYAAEKERITSFLIDALDEIFGGISEAVEMTDLSTPATVHRYTGNWKGSYEGFAPTPKTLVKPLPKRIPSLSDFYMIGQWTAPGGGLPSAAADGRNIALEICRSDKRPFNP